MDLTGEPLGDWLRGRGTGCVVYGPQGAGSSACERLAEVARDLGVRVAYVRVAAALATLLEHDVLGLVEARVTGVPENPCGTAELRRSLGYILRDGIESADEHPIDTLIVIDGIDGCVDWPEKNAVQLFGTHTAHVRVAVSVAGTEAEARAWSERLGGNATLVEAPAESRISTSQDADALATASEPFHPLAVLASAFAPLAEREIGMLLGDQSLRRSWRTQHVGLATRVPAMGPDDRFTFRDERERRAFARAAEPTIHARFVDAASSRLPYFRHYVIAHAVQAGAGPEWLAPYCLPAWARPDAYRGLSHAFAELHRARAAAAERFVALEGSEAGENASWTVLVRSALGIGALSDLRGERDDARGKAERALAEAIQALARQARSPETRRAMGVEVVAEVPANRDSVDPAAIRAMLEAFDRDERVPGGFEALVAALEENDLRRIMPDILPGSTVEVAARLAVLGHDAEAATLALSLEPSYARCSALLRVAAVASPERREPLARALLEELLALPEKDRHIVVWNHAQEAAKALGTRHAMALVERFDDPLTSYSKIASFARIARAADSNDAERATSLAVAAYRTRPDEDTDALGELIECGPWMSAADSAWLLANALGEGSSLANVLSGWAGVEMFAPLIANVGGDALLLTTARESAAALAWLDGPSLPS